jgi:hypothetical protein
MSDVKNDMYLAAFIRQCDGDASLNEDVLLKNSVTIKKDNLIIDGNGHVLDGNGENRIFHIKKNKNVTLKNLVFKNAKAPDGLFDEPKGYGGAIFNEGQLKLVNCEFINNYAKKDGYDILNKGNLKLENCKFSQKGNKNAILNRSSILALNSEKNELEPFISNSNVKWVPEIIDGPTERFPPKPDEVVINPQSTIHEVASELSTASKPVNDSNQGYILYQPFTAYEGDEPFVFISYKHSDYKAVYPIIDKLHKAGIRIWYDAGLPIGRNYDIQIAKHIKKSRLFVTFITEEVIRCADNEDDYLVKEASVAIHLGKEYLPIYLDNVDLAGFYLMHYLGKQSILKFDYGDNEEKFIEACVSAFKDDYGIEPVKNE